MFRPESEEVGSVIPMVKWFGKKKELLERGNNYFHSGGFTLCSTARALPGRRRQRGAEPGSAPCPVPQQVGWQPVRDIFGHNFTHTYIYTHCIYTYAQTHIHALSVFAQEQ